MDGLVKVVQHNYFMKIRKCHKYTILIYKFNNLYIYLKFFFYSFIIKLLFII